MKPSYKDITEKIDEDPQWYDSNGTPRYESFHPEIVPNIYAQVAVLYEIKCQACGETFVVSKNWSDMDIARQMERGESFDDKSEKLLNDIFEGKLSYGDPPRKPGGDCCMTGPTMSSITTKILQVWESEKHEWECKYNKLM